MDSTDRGDGISMARIQIQGVHARLGGKRVLKGIDLEVPLGGIVAIIGPSGCGKTTLLRAILGEVVPDQGRVLLDGEDVTYVRPERRRVGIVYQDYALFPHMTVYENVAYAMRVRRMGNGAIHRRVGELLDLVRLKHKHGAYPPSLSGGEQQRVALARALAAEPRLLLLDEAFTALDATTRVELVDQVRHIIDRLKLTTILVTHDQEEAFLFARHVVVLNDGKVVIAGPAQEVMKHEHPFVKDFVKMVLFHRAKVQADEHGHRYIQLQGGPRLPVAFNAAAVGDEVHVMVKKGPERETFEVWPVGKA
ncbi:MAG TPA: ABC transporter ATP-binding protein [Candidatus Thermoplasmatota archaeon]|nr:ABC transporter ATP-binding protein [Candidatus Thermoplasmatota archaeon]